MKSHLTRYIYRYKYSNRGCIKVVLVIVILRLSDLLSSLYWPTFRTSYFKLMTKNTSLTHKGVNVRD